MNTHLDTITLSGADQSVTVTQDQWDQAMTQLPLFPWDKDQCAAFLTEALTIEDEMDRLRAQLQDLVTDFAERIPLRAMRTALKVVRARKKLAAHPKEPMSEERQAQLEAFIAAHVERLDAAKRQAAAEAEQSMRAIPEMGGTPQAQGTHATQHDDNGPLSTWEREKEGYREHLRSPDL